MINFRKYPYRIGETYGQDGQLTSRQITMAINKPVRQAKKQQQKAPLLAELLTAEPLADFDPVAEYNRRHLPATAVYFAGVVDKLSGDQAKRVAKCEQDFGEWKAQQQKQTGKQLDIFGSCA